MDFKFLRSVARMIKYRSFWHGYPYRDLGINEVYVLGNGPSLKVSLKDLDLSNKELYVLNDFADSEYYSILRPRHYVIADSLYWRKNPDETMLSILKKDTEWDMTLYIPQIAYKKQIIQEYLATNKNVKVVQYHSNYIEGYGEWQKKAYMKNYGMPILANVLVATLYIALNNGVKLIHLLGADHSWTESIKVNSKNEICIADTHFNYETVYTPWVKTDGTPFTMGELLEALSRFFRGQEFIRAYADDLGAKVINETPGSFIDVYERGNL